MLENVFWHTEGRVLVQRFSGLITLDEVERAKEETLEMLRAEAHEMPIHIIIDATQRETYSPDVLKLPAVRQILRSEFEARIGWLLIINPVPHPVMRFMLIAAAHITSNRLKIMASMDEALQFLYDNDASLSGADKGL